MFSLYSASRDSAQGASGAPMDTTLEDMQLGGLVTLRGWHPEQFSVFQRSLYTSTILGFPGRGQTLLLCIPEVSFQRSNPSTKLPSLNVNSSISEFEDFSRRVWHWNLSTSYSCWPLGASQYESNLPPNRVILAGQKAYVSRSKFASYRGSMRFLSGKSSSEKHPVFAFLFVRLL